MGMFDFLKREPKKEEPISGGTGASMQDAVVINAPSTFVGVLLEHSYIRKQCGLKDYDWKIETQMLIQGPNGKNYDLLIVKLRDGRIREFYFDISSFFGKF